jgi:uncharacterized lipoprotein YbaY
VDTCIQKKPDNQIAWQRIALSEKLLPYKFSLRFDPVKIKENCLYRIDAQLSQVGKIVLVNAQNYAVLTKGNAQTNIDVKLTSTKK